MRVSSSNNFHTTVFSDPLNFLFLGGFQAIKTIFFEITAFIRHVIFIYEMVLFNWMNIFIKIHVYKIMRGY